MWPFKKKGVPVRFYADLSTGGTASLGVWADHRLLCVPRVGEEVEVATSVAFRTRGNVVSVFHPIGLDRVSVGIKFPEDIERALIATRHR